MTCCQRKYRKGIELLNACICLHAHLTIHIRLERNQALRFLDLAGSSLGKFRRDRTAYLELHDVSVPCMTYVNRGFQGARFHREEHSGAD
jgi:hypothetical protein